MSTNRLRKDKEDSMPLSTDLQLRLINLLFHALGRLSPNRVARAARVIGAVWYRLDGKHRRIAVANLTRAFGQEKTAAAIDGLAQKVFRNLALIPFEIDIIKLTILNLRILTQNFS